MPAERGFMNKACMLAVVLLAPGACTTQDEESASTDKAGKPAAPDPWQDQQKALQKAGQVEQDVMDAYERRDREMERQAQ
ncbi:MAG: hypothetical protein ACE5FQ_02230 [Thiogranum sp.]